MEGKFFGLNFRRILIAAVCFLAGTAMALRFGLLTIDAFRHGELATAMFGLPFALGFLLLGIGGILMFTFGQRSWLTVDDDGLRAMYGWGSEIDLRFDAIEAVKTAPYALVVRTSTAEHYIPLLGNAAELCRYVRARMPAHPWTMSEAEKRRLAVARCRAARWLITTIAAFFAMMMVLVLCVVLTDGADLGEFTPRQEKIFCVCWLCGLACLIVTFVFADRAGKWRNRMLALREIEQTAQAYAARKVGLPSVEDGLLLVRYVDRARYRLVAGSIGLPADPEHGIPARIGTRLTLEQFVPPSDWQVCREWRGTATDLDEIEEAMADMVPDTDFDVLP